MEMLDYLSCFIVFNLLIICCHGKLPGMLYPRDSESRSIRRLDGMWNFRADMSPNRNESIEEKWYSRPLSQSGNVIPMPVPSSYNDVTNNKELRDFVGWAWYDREFYVDKAWSSYNTVLRLDSAHYNTIVWVNGKQVMTHEGGHLPFEAKVGNVLQFDGANRITVAVNNTLTPTTLPPGTIEYKTDTNMYPEGYFIQNLQMDFFNYAGIHRHVTLYTTPRTYVEDINIVTDTDGTNGIVTYEIHVEGPEATEVTVEIVDKGGNIVLISHEANSTVMIHDANLWWPYTMNATSPGYLYTLVVKLESSTQDYGDVYRQAFGIRTVRLSSTEILINNRPFYCLGVGKHEDSDIRGKGLDYALIARDFVMLKWLGVNCFRTSHYPYAEEIMDQADQHGIVVIDESPGVGIGKTDKNKCWGALGKTDCKTTETENNKAMAFNRYIEKQNKHVLYRDKKSRKMKKKEKRRRYKELRQKQTTKFENLEYDNFGNESLHHHMEVMSEMYQRDKNRPSVIIWSVANEPSTNKPAAGPYFKAVIDHVRSLDQTRPVTFVCNQHVDTDVAVKYVDIILVNRYFGWYSDVGHTEVIQRQLEYVLRNWHKKYNKPMILSEYGADTIAGFHQEPSFVFTEEFQTEFLQEYHKGFDNLRQEFLVGEMVWNFADFMTVEGITRVLGNKKGLLTRQRQPKMAAHLIRDRYHAIINGNSNMCQALKYRPREKPAG